MFDKYELDDRGILPRKNELSEKFVARGNIVLESAITITQGTLIQCLNNIKDKNFFGSDYCYEIFKGADIDKQKALHFIKSHYGMDMSWVRFINMKLRHPLAAEKDIERLLGRAQYLSQRMDGFRVDVPFILINDAKYVVIRHELIHAGRVDVFNDLDNAYVNNLAEEHSWEETVANNWFDISTEGSMALTHHERIIDQLRHTLENCFGDKAGHIFIRLSLLELEEEFLSKKYRGPKELIKTLSREHLKFKIMAEKLGL